MPFVKGKSGNPAGRPAARNSAAADRIRRLIISDVQKHGVEAIDRLRERDIKAYWTLAADVLGLRADAKRSGASNLGISIVVREFRLNDDRGPGVTIEATNDPRLIDQSNDDDSDDDEPSELDATEPVSASERLASERETGGERLESE